MVLSIFAETAGSSSSALVPYSYITPVSGAATRIGSGSGSSVGVGVAVWVAVGVGAIVSSGSALQPVRTITEAAKRASFRI